MNDVILVQWRQRDGYLDVRARLDGTVSSTVSMVMAVRSNISFEEKVYSGLMQVIGAELRRTLRTKGGPFFLAFGGAGLPEGPVRDGGEPDDGAENGKPRRGEA